ncbi:MAG: hypothetical protein CMJ78_00540 [Planctomycetaceae bacterium]|nr:hypothetical protein [Planctomycetaceae bacterium]
MRSERNVPKLSLHHTLAAQTWPFQPLLRSVALGKRHSTICSESAICNECARHRLVSDFITAMPQERIQGRAIIASLMLFAGIGAIALSIAEKTTYGLPFEMLRSWYSNHSLWFTSAIIAILSGAALLRASKPEAWQPTLPGMRFRSVVIYTRQDCPLCDIAGEILANYTRYLPPPEFVDIDESAELQEKFTDCVPVVEMDGRIRYRGQVNEIMLRRLIEGTKPLAETSAVTTKTPKIDSS